MGREPSVTAFVPRTIAVADFWAVGGRVDRQAKRLQTLVER